MDFASVYKDLSDFKSGLIEKVTRLENILKDREREMKLVNNAEIGFQEESDATKSKIQQLNAELTKLDAEKRKKIKDEGVSHGLSVINEKIKDLKSKQRVVASSFPECPVCLEVCDPSQGRLVFCCPDGHTICGQCAERLDKCPTCRMEKSSFGGRFTRVREFESLSGKPLSNEDNVDLMLSISELAQEKKPLVEREKEISALYEGKKSPFQLELDEAQRALSGIEEARQDLRNVREAAETGLTSFVECLKNNLSEVEEWTLQIERGFDSFQDATSSVKEVLKKTTYSLACACYLACPHPLAIMADGSILSEPCGCLERGPCICATHQITLDLAIEGGSSGSVTIDLAGRTNPYAVWRLFKIARENFYAGLIVDDVWKNDCMFMGGWDVNGKERNFTSFTPDEKKIDLSQKHLLHKGNKFEVGIRESKECENQRIIIYTGNGNANARFRTVGVVTKGTEIIEEINNLPVQERKSPFYTLPIKIITIQKSSGKIVTPNVQL